MKRQPVINVHCHLLNFDYVPNRMIKRLAIVPEDIAEDDWFSAAAGLIFATIPGPRFDRIRAFIGAFRSKIGPLTDAYVDEMTEAKTDVCTPLAMDLQQATGGVEKDDVPYKKQIEQTSEQVARYPWRLFPFVMFDPRRQESFDLCKEAIETKGFIGVKMYPALGYYPDPIVMRQLDDPTAVCNLEKLYEYCSEKRIPITTHASTGGAYALKGDRPEEDGSALIELLSLFDRRYEREIWPKTEVSNWIGPLQRYNLKINFAHLGGNYLHTDDTKRVLSATWRRQILNLIAQSRRKQGCGTVYADLSYHDMALEPRTRDRYFEDLRQILGNEECGHGILFGTDASMISHTWSEQEYTAPFRDESNLDQSMQAQIFSDNPTAFLFEGAKVPDSYCAFLPDEAKPDDPTKLPKWIRREGNEYYIVTAADTTT